MASTLLSACARVVGPWLRGHSWTKTGRTSMRP